MSFQQYSAVLENGRLLIRDAFRDLDSAFESVHYWPTRWEAADLFDSFTGESDDPAQIRVQRIGWTYYLRFPRLNFDVELRLPGDTRSVRFERVPVAPPKVRKGIELKWHNGAWCKRLKSGFIPV